jgi:hypothetical protein
MLSTATTQLFEFLPSGKTCVQLHGLRADKLFIVGNVTHTAEHKNVLLPFNPRVLHISTNHLRTSIHQTISVLTGVFSRLSTLSTHTITTTKYKKKRGRTI